MHFQMEPEVISIRFAEVSEAKGTSLFLFKNSNRRLLYYLKAALSIVAFFYNFIIKRKNTGVVSSGVLSFFVSQLV